MARQRVPTSALLLVVPVVSALAVFLTAGFGSGGSATAPSRANEVVIKDFAYSPDPQHVPTGTTVKVKNLDDAAHTLTADDDAFDTGKLDGGVTKAIRLDEPGRYAYHCSIHDYMTGVISVGE